MLENFTTTNHKAKNIKNAIPAKLSNFNSGEGWKGLSRYFPVTSLKLKMAMAGAMMNDRTVAKSTKSFKLSLNWEVMTREPIAIRNRNSK